MFIGVDFGTQSIRCGIVSETGQVVVSNECEYNTYYPHEGWAEQKPAEWRSAFLKSLSLCIYALTKEQKQSILGLSICSTASTVIPVGKDGNEISNAIAWMDIRAKKEARAISDTKANILKYCGEEVSPEWLLAKALWIKNNRRDIYDKAFKIVEFQDYMNHYLTGTWAASICQATCKSTYAEDFGKWDRDMMMEVGFEDFEDKLNTNVFKLGEKIGYLKADIAKEFSLPKLPVYQGGVDAHVCILGIGACRQGDLGIAMGTSFVHLAFTDKPAFSKGLWGPYNNAVIPSLFCIEGGQTSAGSITKWFLKEFNVEGDHKYAVMANEAAKIQPGCDGVVALDFFQGNRTPYKDPFAKGGLYGLTLMHTRAHMYRAVMESVAFGTRNIVDCMKDAGVPIQRIFACGGVTKNDIWMQIISDVIGSDIRLSKNSSQAGILGCSVIAAYGSGRYQSICHAIDGMIHAKEIIRCNTSEKIKYEKAFRNYKAIYTALKQVEA